MAHVVIIGAGPAGAALAYLLARRGVEVTLIERQTDFAREFRGEVLMPSGIDAFAQMGLRAAFDALPHREVHRVELYRNGRFLFLLALNQQQLGSSTFRVVSQSALLELLVAEARRFPSFRIERGMRVLDVLWENERVVGVRAAGKEGERDLRGDLVIGADGRASVLRKRAGLHEERNPQTFDIVWCKIPLPDFLTDGATGRAYLGHGHLAIMFPSYDGRLQIGWVINKGAFGELRRCGIEEWLDEMAQHVDAELAAHLQACRAEISHPFVLDVICDRLVRWTAPGLLLIGDAAHPMSPVGGQGINIALRDALVAANHLCPVFTRQSTPSEIDDAAAQVQEERLPEVSAIQRLQQDPPRLLFQTSPWSGLVLRLLPLLVRTGIAQRLFGFALRRMALGVTSVRLTV
jgi:2-polyprenyl-6-methoxyphenol hydroxylase-like FAD-dependent oxidoreductase